MNSTRDNVWRGSVLDCGSLLPLWDTQLAAGTAECS